MSTKSNHVVTRHVDINIVTRWVARPDGTQENVIEEFHVECADETVDVVLTADAAIDRVKLDDLKAKKAYQRAGAAKIIVTRVTWHNCIPGFEPPTLEVKS